MTRPSNYLIRMAIFLGVITAGVIFLGPSLLDAFWASPVLNGIIVGALLIGIEIAFVTRRCCDARWYGSSRFSAMALLHR